MILLTNMNSQSITIQELSPDNIPSLVAMITESSTGYFDSYSPAFSKITSQNDLAHFVGDPNSKELLPHVAILENADRKAIDYGRLFFNGSYAEIGVVVSEAYRGHRVGEVIVTHLIEHGLEEGIAKFGAHVLTNNMASQRLFKRLGFIVSGNVNEGKVEYDILMLKHRH